MLIARRILAVPVIAIGGAVWLVALLATIAAGAYYTYVGVRTIIEDGDFVVGVLFTLFVPMIAMVIVSLLLIPANALIAAGAWLWGDE